MAAQLQRNLQIWLARSQEVRRLGALNTPAGKAAATVLSLGPEADAIDLMTPELADLLAANQQAVAISGAQAQQAGATAVAALLAAMVAAVLAALGLGLLIRRALVRPLSQVQHAAADLDARDITSLAASITAFATGDLTVPAVASAQAPTYTSRDEIGQTAAEVRGKIEHMQVAIGAYETARSSLQQMIGQVASSAD